MGCLYSFVFAIKSLLIGGGRADRIRIIDGFVGIIDEFIRTIDLLLENKKIA